MAYRAEWTAYYVGHGAMNYIEIFDDNNTIVKVIIIDAGSTDDKFHEKDVNPNVQELINKLNGYESINVVIFVTHTDSDHYSYIRDIYNGLVNKTKIEKLYIGSQGSTESIEHILTYVKNDFSMLTSVLDDKIDILGSTALPEQIELDDIGDMKFWLIANSIFRSGGTTNDNSAVFFLENASGEGFLFTGDITGKTMKYVLDNKVVLEAWREVLGGKNIKMTIPHHGSLDTMLRDKFAVYRVSYRYKTGSVQSRWSELYKKLNLNITGLILSYGYNDKYHHPDGTAIHIYSMCMKRKKQSYGWQAWKSSNRSIIIDVFEQQQCTIWEDGRALYVQNTQREVYPTTLTFCNYFFLPMERNWLFII